MEKGYASSIFSWMYALEWWGFIFYNFFRQEEEG